ncbi:MAG: transcriptional regulator NrdR [Betaproteobacteria bacterium RBG_16_64_18]|nr:MAG: transcriptional regulator NrdR [Betaproteobacteria bacterium RBG_16_64_18]OGA09353.1 MAG: transcriptional regulator NrdR [Betaproteobacteria bacterium RIFCSPLOWO2_02_FULL_65_20]
MKCPYCKADNTGVVDSRLSEDGDSVRRRRECQACGKRFTTYERVELQMPMIVKQNGNRTAYDREKIRIGFMRALHKRPVPTQYVDAAITRIEQRVLALGEREVPSRVIGEMVMRELKKMDDVAYIRFASVYEDFQRVDDFRDAIQQVKRPGAKRVRKIGKSR